MGERDAEHWAAVEEAGELLVEARYEEALLELKRVLSRDANNPYAFNLLGTAFWELGQLEPARDAFRAAVLAAPEFLAARVGLSQALRRMGDFNAAIREARLALERFPGDGDALHALGLAQAMKGERTQARKSLEGYLGTSPELEAETEVRGLLEMLGLGDEGEPLEIDEG